MKHQRHLKFGYGMGAVGKDMVYALVSGFILIYYNTVLGIPGWFTGVMMMAARVFDAVNDPLMGVIVEKTNSKYGKYRPWILSGSVLNAFLLYALFAMPKSVTGGGLYALATVLYVLWGVTYTLMDIPFWSMIPAITEPGKERENLSVVGRTLASVGYAIPTVATALFVSSFTNIRDGYRIFALIVALFFVVAEVICVLLVREKKVEKQKTVSIKQMFSALLANDQALVVVIGIVVFNASLYLTTQLAGYFFMYDMGNYGLLSLFSGVGGAIQILAMASLPMLRKKWSAKSILTGALTITIIGYVYLFVLSAMGIRNLILLCSAAGIIYIGFGLATVLTTIFLADSVDYGEYKNGIRNESVIFSMQTFVVKLASAISVLIAGVGISVIGLKTSAFSSEEISAMTAKAAKAVGATAVPEKLQAVLEATSKALPTPQTPGALLGLRILMMVVPMVGLLFAMVYMRRRYKLDEKENARIAAILRERREKA